MYEFSKEKMGKRFREIRADKGRMSLRAFCRAYGQEAEVWGNLEKGLKREMYVSNLAKLARMFDVSPTWLIYGIGPKYISTMTVDSTVPLDLDELLERVVEDLSHLPSTERTLKLQKWYKRLFGESANVQATPKLQDDAPNTGTTPSESDIGGDKKGLGVLGANPRRKTRHR